MSTSTYWAICVSLNFQLGILVGIGFAAERYTGVVWARDYWIGFGIQTALVTLVCLVTRRDRA